MNILILEPYFGGSHRGFVEAIQRFSAHEITTMTLPPRFWKWRMSGAPFLFSQRFKALKQKPDLLFFSNMIDVAAFIGLAGYEAAKLAKVIYFHENQITYPLSEHDNVDVHYGLINLTSAMVCDEVWFNSDYHRWSFIHALSPFLAQFPDYAPKGLDEKLTRQSSVEPIPVEPLPDVPPIKARSKALRILWNHRWEYDKNPESFFNALERLTLENLDFEVVLLGEGFRRRPPIFDRAKQMLGDRIIQFGYVESREEYAGWVRSCDVVVSCARQEQFGISVAEAVMAGCRPILPNRLVYPDFIPHEQHSDFLYNTESELAAMLRHAVLDVEAIRQTASYPFYDHIKAERIVPQYDAALERIVAER